MMYKAHIKGGVVPNVWTKVRNLDAVTMDQAMAEATNIVKNEYAEEERVSVCEVYGVAELGKIDLDETYRRIDDPAYNEEVLRKEAEATELHIKSNRKYPGQAGQENVTW